MKKLVGIAVVVCMFFGICLCGCGGKNQGANGIGSLLGVDESVKAAKLKDGKITFIESPQKDIISGYYAVEKDGWIYYQSNSKTLEKMKNDGSGRVKICDGEPRQIFIVGDWIYFDSDNGISRIKTNGQEFKRLSTSYPHYMTLEGDWIYFVGDEYFIYKVKIDGTEEIQVSNKPCRPTFAVTADSIYYYETVRETTFENGYNTTRDIGVGLYKMKTDGTGKTLLDSERTDFPEVYTDGNWIYYYLSHGKVSERYQIRPDGTGKTETDDGSITGTVYKNWFYFREPGDLDSLSRMRLDGTEKTKIIDRPHSYKFINNYIYCLTYVNNHWSLVRVNTDGTDLKQLVTDAVSLGMTLVGDWIYCPGNTRNYMFSTDGTDRQVLDPPLQTKQ